MHFVSVLTGCNKDPIVPLASADSAEAVTAAAREQFGNLNEWLREYALDSDDDGVPSFGTEPFDPFYYTPPGVRAVATYEPAEATSEQLAKLGLHSTAKYDHSTPLITIIEVDSPGGAVVDLTWLTRLNLG